MIDFATFNQNLTRIRERIAASCERCGRKSSEVTILPVTKTHPAEIIAHVQRAGLTAVGENRLQEAVAKAEQAANTPVQWELIGHLQSNKARAAVQLFDRIQSVDSAKLVRRLQRVAQEEGKVVRILLQVNTGEDAAKFGAATQEAPQLLDLALQCSHLQVEGWMTIAPLTRDEAVLRRCFASLRALRDRMNESHGLQLEVLSMGMSADMEWAIEEGSTLVRIGSALFGER